MVSPYESLLRDKARALITALQREGLPVESEPHQPSEYGIKVRLTTCGNVVIYYKPADGTFKLTFNELTCKQHQSAVQICWDRLNASQNGYAPQCEYQAYVDGSYQDGGIGYGAIILRSGEEIHRLAGRVEHSLEQRQVAGELEAVQQVVMWCSQQQITQIEILYDYEGIQKWATGEWRAEKDLTRRYAAFMETAPVHVVWTKVKSHTGDRWNEAADQLAKAAILDSEAAEAAKPDPLEQLEETATAFVGYLADQGIAGTFAGVFNNHYARIKIGGGFFDLYDTAKRPIPPHIHGINDPNLKEGLETLWLAFRDQTPANAQSSSESAENPFEEVEYYFELLRPYRGLCFDFTILADALKPLGGSGSALPTDDFDALERIYEQIRTEQ